MLATAKSPNKEDMWGAYLQPFSLKRRASKHFSRRWKASSRSSCHISSFWAERRSPISRWGLCARDFFLSPISLLHSHTPAPQPTPARRSSHPLPICLPPHPYTLQFSLSASLKMFQGSFHPFSLSITALFHQTLPPKAQFKCWTFMAVWRQISIKISIFSKEIHVQ